jgi:hypothetical protein
MWSRGLYSSGSRFTPAQAASPINANDKRIDRCNVIAVKRIIIRRHKSGSNPSTPQAKSWGSSRVWSVAKKDPAANSNQMIHLLKGRGFLEVLPVAGGAPFSLCSSSVIAKSDSSSAVFWPPTLLHSF